MRAIHARKEISLISDYMCGLQKNMLSGEVRTVTATTTTKKIFQDICNSRMLERY